MSESKERWQELSAQAATERDPKRLLELVLEINRLLKEKEQRSKSQHSPPTLPLANGVERVDAPQTEEKA